MKFHPFKPLILISLPFLFLACNTSAPTVSETVSTSTTQPASQPAEPLEYTSVNRVVLLQGTISGLNGHQSSGIVQLVTEDGKYYVRMTENFTFDGAPLPIVALGNKGYKKETATVKLKSNTGVSEYHLPSTIQPTDYSHVVIWCEKFSVPISEAELAAP